MTEEWLREIEQAAKAATPGNWTSDGRVVDWLCGDAPAVAVRWHEDGGGSPVCMVQPEGSCQCGSDPIAGSPRPIEDARHIATADPPTVLALVTEIRRLRQVYETVTK